ncbi:MAG: HesA/MoeB/ThiF family protein, partial [Bacteroidota bacterium]
MSFNHIEKQYYARHFSLPKFGLEGQAKLKNARVLVVGAGGLGCPVLQYLVAAGVGHIGIVDEDIVSMSNLHRQILYSIKDVGHAKAIVAKQRLQLLNPNIIIKAFVERFTIDNAKRLVADYDIVVDGTDNFPTRYLVNDVCVLENKTNVYGSIFRFEGQVAVFNHLLEDGSRSANYRDIFP